MATDANGKDYTPGRCFECRAGEHEDEDDDIKMVTITDPNTKKLYGCGCLCGALRNILLSVGYIVKEVN